MTVTRWPRRLAGLLAVLLLAAGVAWARDTVPHEAPDPALVAFAADIGLRDPAAFARTVTHLRRTGRLPPRYITKSEASRLGWRPGEDLCRVAPGRTIGGDRFGNREGRLPDRPGRVWREADLDFACGRRGAHRLVWSDDGLVYVTVDHYRTFREVPR